jgi:hypothetical protein
MKPTDESLEDKGSSGVAPEEIGSICIDIWRMGYKGRRTSLKEHKKAYARWEKKFRAYELRETDTLIVQPESDSIVRKPQKLSFKDKTCKLKMLEVPRVDEIDQKSFNEGGVTHRFG